MGGVAREILPSYMFYIFRYRPCVENALIWAEIVDPFSGKTG